MVVVSKNTVLLIVFSLSLALTSAQNVSLTPNEPTAYISANGEKTGSGVGTINFSTSFFIKHIEMDEATKQAHINNVLNPKNSFSKVELINITENKDINDKGFMAIVDLKAIDNADLTSKIKFLLNELKVNNVNYNGVLYKTPDFNY